MTAGVNKQLAATGENGRHLYTCPLCEAMCGLEIQVQDGRVASIRGNRDDTWSHGHICPKGATLGAVHEDPDRIRRPMIKVDGQWQEVSWDAAFRRWGDRHPVPFAPAGLHLAAAPLPLRDAHEPATRPNGGPRTVPRCRRRIRGNRRAPSRAR